MSGLLAAYDDQQPVSDETVERLQATLAYRGADARGVARDGPVVIGTQTTWTTPQSVGRSGPVETRGVRVGFAGRLDARERLAPALPASQTVETTDDARLVAHGYARWGMAVFDRLIGAFALAVSDPASDRLIVARDPTGLRSVFFARQNGRFVAASDLRTVRVAPGVDTEPDDRALVALLRREPGDDRLTPFAGVERLPPGSRAVVDGDGVSVDRYWHPASEPAVTGSRAGALRDRLRAAVGDRLRCRGRAGLSLSGGLDSVTLAATAETCDAPTPTAHSLVFESVPDGELTGPERGRICDAVARYDLTASEVVGDPHPPLTEPGGYAFSLAESPTLDPLRPAMDRLQRDARGSGRRVLLSGTGGNALDGSRFVYADLLRRGRLRRLAACLGRDRQPTRWLCKWYGLAPLFPRVARRLTDTGPPAWLGATGRAVDPGELAACDRLSGHRHRRCYRQANGLDRELSLHIARRRAIANGLTLRFPYRDARVVALLYGVPAGTLFDGRPKALFRAAFGDSLPESVRAVRAGTAFGGFVVPGLQASGEQLAAAGRPSRLERRGLLADGAYAGAIDRLETAGEWQQAWYAYGCERWLAAHESS